MTDLTPYQLYVVNSLTTLVVCAVIVGMFSMLAVGLYIARGIRGTR